jgi:hypothetical protein
LKHHRLPFLPILLSVWALPVAPAALAQDQPQTLELQVASSAGDGEEFLAGSLDDTERWPAGYSYLVSSDVELGNDSRHGPQLVGLRFERVDIPAGARIEEAVLIFTADSDQSGPVRVAIGGQAEPRPAEFRQDADGTGGHDLSVRPISASAVTWSPEPWTGGREHRSPDIARVVQELVNQPGWQRGGSLVLLIRPEGSTGDGYRSAHSYDSRPAQAPRLLVRFSETNAATPVTPARGPALAAEQNARPAAEPSRPAAANEAPAPQAAPSSEPRRTRFSLDASHEHGVRGSVLLSDYGLGGTVVTVLLDNASPGTSYSISLHSGGCGSGSGAVTVLEPVAGERAFSASLVTAGFDELAAGPYHVNVFRESAGFTNIAGCAPLGG